MGSVQCEFLLTDRLRTKKKKLTNIYLPLQTLPSSFPAPSSASKKTTLLSHLLFTHQTTLSDDDLNLFSTDLAGAKVEMERLAREGMRLFGVGGAASELVEWGWGSPGGSKEVGRIKVSIPTLLSEHSANSYLSTQSTLPTLPPIFALASSPSSSHLAISCEDSTIRILSILDGSLDLIASVDVGGPGKVRAISLAWGYPSPSPLATQALVDDEEASLLPLSYTTPISTHLYAGLSHSTLRRYDASTPLLTSSSWRGTNRMTLDKHPGEQTVVWALLVLPASAGGVGETLVSGDSMGNVKIWDAVMGTQTQSFKVHRSDVLTLALGSVRGNLASPWPRMLLT